MKALTRYALAGALGLAYLVLCHVLDAREADVERCAVVRCAP